MFEKTYQTMTDQITTPPEVMRETLALAATTPTRRGKGRRRPLIAAAALLACLIFATPVLAANIPAIYELMASISPELALHFTPVQRSCEDNGLRLEVISAYIQDDTANIYFTLQDLSADRLDNTSSIDSFNISTGSDHSAIGTCPLLDYDPESKTATFLATLSNYDHQLFSGSKVTFSLHSLMSGRIALENVPIDLDLTALGEPAMQEVRWTGGSTSSTDSLFEFPDPFTPVSVMVPGEPIYQPMEVIWICQAGYLDDRLHIQTATIEPLRYEAYGQFYLVDADHQRHAANYGINFSEQWGSPEGTHYSESVFAIPQSDIDQYTLYANFYANSTQIKGDWQVTFPLEEAPAE